MLLNTLVALDKLKQLQKKSISNCRSVPSIAAAISLLAVNFGKQITQVAAIKFVSRLSAQIELNGSMLFLHGNLATNYNAGKMAVVKIVVRTMTNLKKWKPIYII